MNRREFTETFGLFMGAAAFNILPVAAPLEDDIGGSQNMEKVRLKIAPTSVPEWDKEDEMSAVLGGEELHKADDTQAKAMLDQISLELPVALNWVELVRYAQQHPALGGLTIPPDSTHFSFYLIEMPLTIIVPESQRLVRLRLVLDLTAEHAQPSEVLAYDVFPPSEVDIKKLASGGINLDVSKALQLVLTATGAASAAPVADCLGFKLDLPFEWKTTAVKLESSGRMSNHVQWYVADDSIQKGFAPTAILRAPKGATVTVAAAMAGELRFRGPVGWFKSQFAQVQPHQYVLR
jgi:hypothetical protein